jgi:hypothetical protein
MNLTKLTFDTGIEITLPLNEGARVTLLNEIKNQAINAFNSCIDRIRKYYSEDRLEKVTNAFLDNVTSDVSIVTEEDVSDDDLIITLLSEKQGKEKDFVGKIANLIGEEPAELDNEALLRDAEERFFNIAVGDLDLDEEKANSNTFSIPISAAYFLMLEDSFAKYSVADFFKKRSFDRIKSILSEMP